MSKEKEIDIKKIISLKGKVRGDVLRTSLSYIKNKGGIKGLQKIEKKARRIGLKISLENIKNTQWYPISYEIFILELIRKNLMWKDEDIVEMGKMASKNSFVIRIILRFFVSAVSVEKSFKETSKYWSKYWLGGEFIPEKIDMNKKFSIIVLKNFKIHPDLCFYFLGHFKSIAQLLLGKKNVNIREVKCSFKDGGDSHVFKITW